MTIEETIDAFVDAETIDAAALDAALASAEGRAYLIDALALRQLMGGRPAEAATPVSRRGTLHLYARAAVVAIALVGLGYAAGARVERPAPGSIPATAQISEAPEPTRVIELTPGVNWHESKGGD